MSMINEFVEKLINRLEEELKTAREMQTTQCIGHDGYGTPLQSKLGGEICALLKVQNIVNQLAEECKDVPDTNVGKWIPVSEKLPDAETDVIVLAKIKFKDGDFRHIITTGFYEDGTVASELSHWDWDGFLDSEWNEEEGCYIIPEGWWENCYYNTDEVYINAIDDEVVAWQPLPPCWKGE